MGQAGDAAQGALLADAVAKALGKSFRLKRVLFVSDLPKTRSIKIMRRVVRTTLTGQPAGDLSSLVNPESVDELRPYAEASALESGGTGP